MNVLKTLRNIDLGFGRRSFVSDTSVSKIRGWRTDLILKHTRPRVSFPSPRHFSPQFLFSFFSPRFSSFFIVIIIIISNTFCRARKLTNILQKVYVTHVRNEIKISVTNASRWRWKWNKFSGTISASFFFIQISLFWRLLFDKVEINPKYFGRLLHNYWNSVRWLFELCLIIEDWKRVLGNCCTRRKFWMFLGVFLSLLGAQNLFSFLSRRIFHLIF